MATPTRLPLRIDKEGRGWFRGTIGNVPIVGIWKHERGCLVLCWNDDYSRIPKRFEDGEQRDLLTLWAR